jgi:ferric-dicitrate binding protein FerR (iron transport regulator)
MMEEMSKYFGGEMSSIERVVFLKKVKADVELKKEYIHIRNTCSLMNLMPDKGDHQEGEDGFKRFMRQKTQRYVRVVLYKTLAYAASIALLVGMVWSIAYKSGFSSVEMFAEQTNEIQAPAGQRTKIILSDGTLVWLNSKSKLVYPPVFMKERNVRLTGEAYFEVAADPQKPFTVSVDDVKVTALGTAFNVSGFSETEQVQVALFEGSVKITTASGQEIILNPNQLALYRKGSLETENIRNTEQFLWKDGIYGFVNEPLINIIRKLELYYDIHISVADSSILEYKYTGKFRQLDGVETILSMIQNSYPFKYEKNGNDYVLKK